MKRYKIAYIFFLFIFCNQGKLLCQNETSKWYFGSGAGLDFMTNPPTVLTNGSLWAPEGCSTISDQAGNLLFYTDGETVWNSTHSVMGNGNGLLGSNEASQSCIIVKQPGNSNIYFIFTLDESGGTNGFNYSTVDMNLAAGAGSVTSKNVSIYANLSSEKLTAVKHCNGVDTWVIIRDWDYFTGLSNTNNFRSYLVTAAGINPTPVISPASTYPNSGILEYGCMKASPNGKKLGVAMTGHYFYYTFADSSPFEIYDFNNNNGVISNLLALTLNIPAAYNLYLFPYGCEFSPDGTKFYGSNPVSQINQNNIIQWDLCAGSNSAIVASAYTLATTSGTIYPSTLQLAMNGKIYGAMCNSSSLLVINSPNLAGAASNLVLSGLSVAPGTGVGYGLPNFVTSFFTKLKPPLPPFTYTVSAAASCLTGSFTAYTQTVNCPVSDYSVTGIQWLFGDPLSGPANTSTLFAPSHIYPAAGNYTAQLIFIYECGADTVTVPVVIPVMTSSLLTCPVTCTSLGSATLIPLGGTPPYTYTWNPSAQSGSVATSLTQGIYSVTAIDNSGGCIFTATTSFINPPPFTGTVSATNSLSCNGINTGTASIALTGWLGTKTYSWQSSSSTQSSSSASGLGAGTHTVTVTDAITSCTVVESFQITQPPALTLNIVANTASACAGSVISFTAINSGGTPGPIPGYSYSWMSGPATDTYTVSQLTGGNYGYSVTSYDGNNCSAVHTIAVNFVNYPVLSVPDVSICPLQTGTLIAQGATTYMWNASQTGNTFSDNPLATTIYTVSGESMGCSSTTTASIILKPVPTITITSNNSICSGQALNLSVNPGSTYQWNGPDNFISSQQSPTISVTTINNDGVYSITLTAANNCTASSNHTVLINPTPTPNASASTVCVNQTFSLSSTAPIGSTYLWSGPNSFTSNLQNPGISMSTTLMTGIYDLTVTSSAGCSATTSAYGFITTPPQIGIAPNNTVFCAGSLLTMVGSGGNSYSWSGPGSFTSSQQTISIANIPVSNGGNYTLAITYGPCTVTGIQAIIVHPLPVPVAGHLPVCDGGNLQLTANSGSTYFWSGPAAFTSTLQSPLRNQVSFVHAGIYSLTLTDINNCQASAITSVAVLPNPTVTATGTTVCYGSKANLTVNGGLNYLWSGPAGYTATSTSPGITINEANALTSGNYSVTGIAANSCSSFAIASLSIIALPVPTVSIPTRICFNSTLSLQAWGGNSYLWKGPYNFSSSNQNIILYANNTSLSGTYSLAVTNTFGCVGYTTALVDIEPAPRGILMSDVKKFCVPFCSNFTIKPTTNSPITNIAWLVDSQHFSGNTLNYCIQKPGATVISSSFTNAAGCSNFATFTVDAYPLPTANFDYEPTTIVENMDEVLFTNTSAGNQLTEYNWFFMNNDNFRFNTQRTSYFFDKAGVYPVALVVKNYWGCSDTIVKAITVNSAFSIYVPNTFTPNNDYKNDTFIAKGVGVANYSLSIFNRWGEKVFETTDIANGWDGTFNGIDCKMDTYAWKINASDNTGNEKDLKGFLTLYR